MSHKTNGRILKAAKKGGASTVWSIERYMKTPQNTIQWGSNGEQQWINALNNQQWLCMHAL